MAKIKKPAPKKGGPAKPAPTKKPMRRKSKRAVNSLLPHVDVTAPKLITAEAAGKEVARLAAGVMSAVNLVEQEPKPTLWHRFRSGVKRIFRFRSAATGEYVTKEYAEANPNTTVRERAD